MAEIITLWNQGWSYARLSEKFGNTFALASLTLEVTTNIEVAGALVGGGALDVYFAPNSQSGFYDAINAALGLSDEVRDPTSNRFVDQLVDARAGLGKLHAHGSNSPRACQPPGRQRLLLGEQLGLPQ